MVAPAKEPDDIDSPRMVMGSVLRLSEYRQARARRPEQVTSVRILVSATRDDTHRTTTGLIFERRLFSDGTFEQVPVIDSHPFGPHRFS